MKDFQYKIGGKHYDVNKKAGPFFYLFLVVFHFPGDVSISMDPYSVRLNLSAELFGDQAFAPFTCPSYTQKTIVSVFINHPFGRYLLKQFNRFRSDNDLHCHHRFFCSLCNCTAEL